MKKTIEILTLSAILAWAGCNHNNTPCPSELQTYTCQAGQFAATPPVFNIRQGVSPAGEWEVILLDGWEYELPENQSQWLKLCGDSFRFIPSNKDAVMLAARRLNDVIEISPYYNENSAQLYYETSPEGWPKVEVQPGQVIGFRYYVVPGAVVTEIDYAGVQYLHSVNHSGITNHVREINFYAGGSVPPVATISLKKRRVDGCDMASYAGGDSYRDPGVTVDDLIGTWAYVRTFKADGFDKNVYGHMEITPDRMLFGRVGWFGHDGIRHEYPAPLIYDDIYELLGGVVYMPYFNYDLKFSVDTFAIDTIFMRNLGPELSTLSLKR